MKFLRVFAAFLSDFEKKEDKDMEYAEKSTSHIFEFS
jgi:hypothetical protein